MPTVAAYYRLSEDRTGEAEGIERQRSLTQELAVRLGLTIDAEYVDNDTSATSGAERPAFDRMLSDRPGVILAWAQDRLLRLTTDLERVIALDATVHTVVAGTLDLSTPAGRAVARTVAAWSTFEGEQKADRQRAKNQQRVRNGYPLRGGKRAFGYLADHVTPHETEGPLVAQAYADVLAGRSLYSIAQGWRQSGVTGPYGHEWTGTKVRKLLLNERNAGRLTYRGERAAQSNIIAIVDAATFDGVGAILADERRKLSPGPIARVSILAGQAHCACGAPMRSATNTQKGRTIPLYVCSLRADGLATGKHPSIRRRIADGLVLGAIYPWLVWLKQSGGDLALSGGVDLGPLRAKVAQIREARVRVQAVAEFDGADLDAIRSQLLNLGHDLAQAEAELAQARTAHADGRLLTELSTQLDTLSDVFDGGKALLALWASWPLDLQRQVVGLFDVTIAPGTGPERVQVTREGMPLPTFREDTETGEVSLYVPER